MVTIQISRPLRATGGSFRLTLPRAWVLGNRLANGDELVITYSDMDELKIIPLKKAKN